MLSLLTLTQGGLQGGGFLPPPAPVVGPGGLFLFDGAALLGAGGKLGVEAAGVIGFCRWHTIRSAGLPAAGSPPG